MSTENEDLFEGLEIMSPEDLNSAVETKNEEAEKTETTETTGETKKEEEGEELFTPVSTESGEGSYEKEKGEAPTNESKEPNLSKNEAIYKGLMKELIDAGVLTSTQVEQLEELPGTLDTIKDLVNQTVKQKFASAEEAWKNNMPAAKKRFLEIEDAFDETDQAIMMAQRLEFFDNIDEKALEEDENLQKQVYFDLLKSKNFSDQDATDAIDDAVSMNKLKDKALKAIPELKQEAEHYVGQAKAYKEERTKKEIAQQEEAFKSLISHIDSRESFIDGLNLNKPTKDKLKANILNPIYKDPKSGREYNSLMYKQQRNPVEFEMLINYYDTLGLFNLDKQGKFKPDISKLKAVAKTAAINDLDKIIAAEEQRGVGRNTSVETSQKTEGILGMLENAFKNK